MGTLRVRWTTSCTASCLQNDSIMQLNHCSSTVSPKQHHVDPSPSLNWCMWQAGAFRIGDTAGTLDNIVHCKLHRPGSVGFVSKSGGMSNELYNVLARASDGLYEGQYSPPHQVELGASHRRIQGALLRIALALSYAPVLTGMHQDCCNVG